MDVPSRSTRLPRRDRRTFTLIELTVSASILALLLGAMASAVIVAGHAIPSPSDPAASAAAAQVIANDLAGDLYYATAITVAEPHQVTFTVADRGHGDPGAETIHYEWSGTPGDPLMRRYNGGDVIEIRESVEDFALEYVLGTRALTSAPRVMLVIANAGAPSPLDVARRVLMESWGFVVQPIDDFATFKAVDDLLLLSDVVYLSSTIRYNDLDAKYENANIGMVIEAAPLYDDVGISEGAHTLLGNDRFWIVDDTHEITEGMGTGATVVFDYYQKHVFATGEIAPGGRVLSQWPGFDPTTVVVDIGDELLRHGAARDRRVGLLWGDDAFEVIGLHSTGRKYMRRAVEWASTPHVYAEVRITLQPTAETSTRTETQVPVLNTPETRPR